MNTITKTDEASAKKSELFRVAAEMRAMRTQKIAEAKSDEEAIYWASRTINDMLKTYHYMLGDDVELDTFRGWLKKGSCVCKGEKGLAFFTAPIKAKGIPIWVKSDLVDTEYKYWGICYLFRADQTKKSAND